MKPIFKWMFCMGLLIFIIPISLADEEADEGIKKGDWLYKGQLSAAGSWTNYDNWQAGGTDALTISGTLDFSAKFARGNSEWLTSLKVEYGVTKLENIGTRKSSDSASFESRYDYKFNQWISLYGRVAAVTELAKGYLYYDDPVDAVFFDDREPEYQTDEVLVSDALDPSDFTEGIGLGYKPYNNEDNGDFLYFRMGIGARQLVVSNYYIVEDDEDTDEIEFSPVDDYTDYGLEDGFELQFSLQDNVILTSKATGFYGFDEELWKITWDTKLTVNVNRYFGIALTNAMIYDESVIDEYQWKSGALLTLNIRIL